MVPERKSAEGESLVNGERDRAWTYLTEIFCRFQELPECNSDDDGLCDIDPSRLLLENAKREFHGNYTCEGMNEAGWGPLSEGSELVVYCELPGRPGDALPAAFLSLNRISDFQIRRARPPSRTRRLGL